MADQPKRKLYLALLPALHSGRVELLDHQDANRRCRSDADEPSTAPAPPPAPPLASRPIRF